MDIISYALCKKIAAHAVSGVQSMSVEGQNLIINTKDSGVLTMTFPTPKDGVSVTDIDVNANNQIVFTMSDGSEFISGKIPAVKGEPGFSPTITENVDNTDKIYKLDITTADSTFTTPNLKGADGQGGTGGGEANIIDSISVNGVNVAPDENKNVDIEIPSIEGLATETYVDNKIADYTKTADLADVAKSGNYEDLSNKPTIPTVTDEYNAKSSEAASGKAINQAMSTLKGLPKPYFVFVDDDGKENFKTLYTDILQPRGIVGGLSIVFSSYTIDANKYLTQNEINEYSNLGWDILCHSTDLNSLTIDTADAVLNYCDNRIAHYGFKKSNIFVYPNGNEGDNKIAIEEKVAKHFKYAFNINYSHNCPANIPLQNRMDIGRIIIPKASEITAEVKAYYKNLVDETINGNKLMIISTHSDKSDYTYLTELLDYILNQGYSFTSPVKALSEIDEYRFQNKLIPGDNISITPDNIISASFTESDPTVPSHVKSITAKNISDWNNKSDFSGSYNDLIDTPAIPSIEGLAKTEDIPTKVSDLENDSKYQTESDVTTILTDYATKTYVGEQIANAEHLKREIVTVLPSDEEASDNIIYMLKVESATGNDKYQEYMKIDGTVQMVGDTSVDLTDYAKTADIPTTLPADGGNSNTVNNHTVEIDVPADALFTDTIYNDTEVKGSIGELSSNLDTLEFGEVAGGKNLFNKETAHIGKVILFSSGEMITNADYFCTDYIPVIPNTTYVRSAFTTLGENWYYDIDKNPLNSIQENENIFTTPENAYYVRLSGGVPNVDIAQLEEGSVATEYEPYIPSVKMLAEEVNQQNESLSTLGKCKNLINPTLQTTTINGVTCIANGDGTYTLKGKSTSSSNTNFVISFSSPFKGKCKLIGCPSDIDSIAELQCNYNGVWDSKNTDHGKGSILDSTNLLTDIAIVIFPNVTVNNLVFKPMITTDLSATYDDFVPYTGKRETLTADVAKIKNDLNASNAGAHNSIYRGKYLGNALTTEQKAQISAGTFDDMYIGDYWTIGGVNYRIAAFDYWYRCGDTDLTTHHVVIVPESSLYSHVMNDTNVTTGGYVGSKMYTEGLEQAKTTIKGAFGEANILTHREYLTNATTNGYASAGAWYDSEVDLMNENMVYGSAVFRPQNSLGATIPNSHTIDKSILPLFQFRPDLISNRITYWLRDVVNATYFALVPYDGTTNYGGASFSYGVRPAFGLKG